MSGVAELLLAPGLTPGRAAEILRPYGFADPGQADRELQALARDPQARRLLAEVLDAVLAAAAAAADPDAALFRLERFVRAAGSAARVFSHLRADPRMVEVLVRALGGSPFLAEILIRQPNWLYWLSEPEVLEAPRTAAEMAGDLERALAPLHSEERRKDALRIAKRREILRIAVRDLLRRATVLETLDELSRLAAALIPAALQVGEAALRASLGLPPAQAPPGLAVLALGKLGGHELNFSSDVDLVYLYRARARPGAREAVGPSRERFHHALARCVTGALAEVTAEGFVYRVDLRLRPEGGAGTVALPLSAFRSYYHRRGAAWERLALIKAWPVAGDLDLGARAVAATRAFVFASPFGPAQVAEVRRLKEQGDARLAARGEAFRHVKLGTGGIREIELAAQVLQARAARRAPALRVRGTVPALDALAERGLLPAGEHEALRRAYVFLRDLENKLQMAADAQTHVLPDDEAELRRCARRLGYRDTEGGAAAAALRADYRRHTAEVHAVFERIMAPPPP